MPNTQNLATVGVTNRQDTDNIIVEQGGNIRRVQYEDIKTDILKGDAADGIISTFEESAEEFPIPAPATPQKTLWGRVKKFCSDFNDWKTGVMLFGHLVNNAESDSDTLPLAASVAKLLQEQITTNASAITANANAITQLNSEALSVNTVYTKTKNDNAGIINDMYHSWNTFKYGVVALLYRNYDEAWIGLINKYDNDKGSILLINSWDSIKVYRHNGTVLTDIYTAS